MFAGTYEAWGHDMTTGAKTLRFTLLGPLRAWRGPQELDLGSRQQRTLLALLLVRQGRPAPVDALVADIWGDRPPPRAVGSLRTYVSRLRKELEIPDGAGGGPRVLVSEHGAYALRVPAEAVDLGLFGRDVAAADLARAGRRPEEARTLLRTALALWGDEPLAGLGGPGVDAERSRLEGQRLAALETRLALDVELGEHIAVLGELRALAERHPLRERLSSLLMRAYVLSGQGGEALAVHERTRRLLAAEFGIDPGHEMAAIAEGITSGATAGGTAGVTGSGRAAGEPVHEVLRDAPTAGTARTGLPARAGLPGQGGPVGQGPGGSAGPEPVPDGLRRPAQIPRDLADFTGRDEALAQLTGELTGASGREPAGARPAPVAVVSGSTGVGKSALAVHAAHRVRGHFPDGQLYADLRAPDGGAVHPAVVLESFLRALRGSDRPVPERQTDRAALYRSELAEARVLVVLDNVADPAAVDALLPGGPGCAALITSTARFSGLAGARHTHLGALSRAEALSWLRTAIGAERVAAEPEACVELADRCGGLPLALRIVAMRLATRPSWAVASVVAALRGPQRLTALGIADLSVHEAFRREYGRLPAALRPVFARVALLREPDGQFGPTAVALALGVPSGEARALCEELVDRSWLESARPGRYHVHGLLREFAVSVQRDGPGPRSDGERPAAVLFAPDGADPSLGSRSLRRPRRTGEGLAS
ncbi:MULTISPECIES: BTAD domain-containing putative transcriptional regulator [Streptomyces]|uniref:AfsR/SARP family transcriptional regulator n=1 Tax=Streptomyces TaxID=1883 RepID=UPI00131EBD93|nr:BTAD domain-containing putative transcriptional regulator [Streptomyces virginiae]